MKRYSTWVKPSDLNKDNEGDQRPIFPPNNLLNDSGLGKAHLVAPKDSKAKGPLLQPMLEVRGLKPIQRRTGSSSSYAGCMPMEDSGVSGAEIDMEFGHSSSVVFFQRQRLAMTRKQTVKHIDPLGSSEICWLPLQRR